MIKSWRMKISFKVEIWREGKMYVSYAPEFSVASCGKKPEEARKNIGEAVELFLEEAKKMGTLKGILKEAHFEKQNGSWEGPEFISIEKRELALT